MCWSCSAYCLPRFPPTPTPASALWGKVSQGIENVSRVKEEKGFSGLLVGRVSGGLRGVLSAVPTTLSHLFQARPLAALSQVTEVKKEGTSI